MVAELSVAEAAIAKAAVVPSSPQPPVTVDNPFGAQDSLFTPFPATTSVGITASPFPSAFDSFMGAAQLFPAPTAPFAAPNGQDGNFFDAAVSTDLDVTETKDSFGGITGGASIPPESSKAIPFEGAFDFTKSQPPPQQSFGVVEVKDAHNFFAQDGLF